MQSILRRQFYCGKQTVFRKASKFFLHKLEFKNKLGLDITFNELIYIVLPLLHVPIQEYIDMRVLKNSAELYELLLNYGSRYDTASGEESCNPGLRGTRGNQFNSFSSEFNEGNGNGF